MKQRRLTTQRKLVLEALQDLRGQHPSALSIHQQIQQKHPQMNVATVYNQLRNLSEDGVIRIFPCQGSADRFDCEQDEHSHIRCEKCGEIHDVKLELPSLLEDQAAALSGFTIINHHMMFNGICPLCQANF